MADELHGVLALFVQVLIVAAILLLFLGVTASGSTSIDPQVNTAVTIDSDTEKVPSSVTVEATTGNALRFPGDGYVESSASTNLTAGSWTACATGQLSSDANQDATYTLYAHENASVLLQFDAGQWMAYYNDSTSSAKATLPANNPSAAGRSICGRYNATADTVTVSRNSAVSGPVAMDGQVERRNVSSDWYGKMDEVRTFNASLANSTLTAYASDPIEPKPGTSRLARYMFDEGSGGTTTVYFAGETATLHNLSWTGGIAGPDLSEGADYALRSDPFALEALSGGYLVGAPVAYVSWNDFLFDIGLFGGAIGILILIPLAGAAAWLMREL